MTPDILSLSGLEIGLISAVVVLLATIWCLTRHQECNAIPPPDGSIVDLATALAGVTHSHLSRGNSIELIQNEIFFERLVSDLDQAERTVHVEAFLWCAGVAATMVSDALIRASGRGVTVRVLVDARGSSGIGEDRERMRDAGCSVRTFHRWRPSNLGRFNIRDHRKIVVIDGRIAYVGGHCIGDPWIKQDGALPRYRDISGRFRGPVILPIQSTFAENWSEATGEYPLDDASFPEQDETGDVMAHVVSTKADGCPSSVQVLHHAVLSLARKTLRIQNPYFIPDPQVVMALVEAVGRGVRVEVMTPATEATDSPWVTRAGHFTYLRLLEGGVIIHEYQKTLLHQKVMTIDGQWCSIGSTNFDDRSFEINDEITIGIFDPLTTGELDRIFDEDLEDCRTLELNEWRRRSIRDKATSRILYLFNEQF